MKPLQDFTPGPVPNAMHGAGLCTALGSSHPQRSERPSCGAIPAEFRRLGRLVGGDFESMYRPGGSG